MNAKNTNAAAVTNVTAAAVKGNENAHETNATNAAPVFPEFTPVQVLETAVCWIGKYTTISNIRADYAALVAEIGKKNYTAVLKQCQTTRAAEIERAANDLNNAVFTGSGILSAVMGAISKEPAYTDLCKFARRAYEGNAAAVAAAVIRDYFTAVDNEGRPLSRVMYINANGAEMYAAYELKPITHTNAVSILKSSFDGMKRAATNAATRTNGNDNAAATRDNVKTAGVIVAVYAAALDETERATIGARRDNSKDERTRAAAAALMGKSLPVGVVPVSVWNAAKDGNETAADILETAHNAAKDAAAKVTPARVTKPAAKVTPAAVAAKRDAVRAVANDLNITTDAAAMMQ